MLTIRTGLPGAGKTLNAIREIDIEHQPDPNDPTKRLFKDQDDPDLPPRTIYYYGIPELKADRLKSEWIEFDTPEKWFDLPDGSVIVIDEAQRVFGNEGTRARAEKITRFETHRHQGLDIHLITQHPSLLAPAVRKLAGKHINFLRPYGRVKGIFRHEYEFCIDSPEKRANFKMSQESKVTLDKTYMGTYKSSSVHTHKAIRPTYLKALYGSAAFILLCFVGLMYLGFDRYSDAMAQSEAAESAHDLPTAEPSKVAGTAVEQAAPADDYIAQRTPRIDTLPSSAPQYDELTKPRDFPRLYCTSSVDERVVERFRKTGQVAVIDGKPTACQCYTQQGTRMATDVQFCVDAVTNGIFDDTRTQPIYAAGGKAGIASSQPPTTAVGFQRGPAANSPQPAAVIQSASNSFGRPAVTVVSDSEYPSRPWR